METYHKIVLAVAASVLLLYLLTVGFMMRRDDSDKPWPPIAGRCPDGWKEDSDKLNKCYILDSRSNVGLLGKDTKSEDFNKYNLCEKKKWADKWGVYWDGVSNYNKCK
jgi:hypothetical protein